MTRDKFDECWDNTGTKCCIWYYTPQGFREHVGTFRARYKFRHTSEMADAKRHIHSQFIDDERQGEFV